MKEEFGFVHFHRHERQERQNHGAQVIGANHKESQENVSNRASVDHGNFTNED